MRPPTKPAIAPCPLCRGKRAATYHWQGYQVCRCATCRSESLATLPSPEELQQFYQDRSARKMTRWERRARRVAPAFDAYLRRIRELTGSSPRSFLDLGGGASYYALAAMEQGIDASVMDWAEDTLEFNRDVLGLADCVQGDVQNCADELDGRRFDFVLARHVIEHMIDPALLVSNISRILAPDGVMAIETPDVESREQFAHPRLIQQNYAILRRDNPDLSAGQVRRLALSKSASGINPPKHLWGLTLDGMQRILEGAGFELLRHDRAIAGHPLFDPLYYEHQPLSERSGLGVPYYFFERSVSRFFGGRGMNLAVLARRRSTAR